ncbi:MAG: CBS domain-containing protein [Thermoleophilia bacterium]|nr:CBS domain-containing protein [Thermoleophilia bacterium]
MKRVRDAMSELNAMVGPEHTLRQASERMVHHRTGAAVVMDHALPGPCVITERDLLKAIAAGKDVDVEVVGDHMTGSLITAAPEWPLVQAADQMVRHGIRHVLVFEGPELVGILSMRDVIRVGGLGPDVGSPAD